MKTSNDPYYPEALYALRDFDQEGISAEQALDKIWKQMDLATKDGWPVDPYVKLSDMVTFPDQREPDPEKEQAAAEWMAELATREPEND